MTISEDFQLEYRGVLCGGETGGGREVVTLDVLHLPDLRTGDTDRPLDHGQYSGDDFLSGRSVTGTFEVWGRTEAELYAAYAPLLAATVPESGEDDLKLRLPEWPDDLLLRCKPRRRHGPRITEEFALLKGEMRVEWWATDPRLQGATLLSDSVALGGSTPGLTFPATFALTFGGIGTSSLISATNVGNFESRPVARLDGPVTNGIIENVTAGKALRLNGVLATGEFLLVDFASRTVLLNGTASRYSWVADPEQWWVLAPGLNDVRFTGTGTGTMTMSWRPAWV